MEPLNATVHVKPDACEIWTGTQIVSRVQSEAAKAAALPVEKVIVNNHLLGGGFGRKLEPDMVVAAVRVAKQVDGPVKVVWTREEDIQHDVYRPVYRNNIAAVLVDGKVAAWKHKVTGSAILARWLPPAFQKGIDIDAIDAAVDMPYDIPNFHVEYVRAEPPAVPTGFWRGVGPNNNVFAIECAMDELARKAGKDPIEFRRAMLGKKPRALAVLNLAAEKAGWGEKLRHASAAASPCSRRSRRFIATMVEAEVDEKGEVQLRRVTSVVDTGIAVNPDTVKAQLEGGLIFGLTAALYGEVTIDKGRVQQSNFHDYRMLRINQMPKIEVHVVKSGEPPGGIGETGVNAGPPALRNAIYAATGVALRRLPIDRADRGGRKHEYGLRILAQRRRHRHGRRSVSPPGSSAAPARSTLPAARRCARRYAAPIRPAYQPRLPRQASSSAANIWRARRTAWSATPAPGGKEYAGGLGFKLPFGTLYSTNITPDKETGIGNYSDQDFLNAVHRGKRHDGAMLYPAMPYTSYTYMRMTTRWRSRPICSACRRCAPRRLKHACFPVQPALGDDVLVGGVQPGHALYAGNVENAGVEPRRVSRGSAGPLRRMPHAAQSRLRARQPQEIRRRDDGGLARVQHQLGQEHRRRRLER